MTIHRVAAVLLLAVLLGAAWGLTTPDSADRVCWDVINTAQNGKLTWQVRCDTFPRWHEFDGYRSAHYDTLVEWWLYATQTIKGKTRRFRVCQIKEVN